MTKIIFRADGGPTIGMGHIMRCVALADAFSDNIDINFITKDNSEVIKLLSDKGYRVLSIDKEVSHEQEIKAVKELIKDNKVDILITDSYHIDQQYLLEIKDKVDKLVTIHDYVPFEFPSDIVINGNTYAPDLDYKSLNGDAKFLLGTDYTLMREEFQNLPAREINEEVKNVLVTVGGSDPLNLTPKILRSLNQIKQEDLQVDVVVGPGFDNIYEIIKVVKNINLEVSLNFNVNKISELMIESDLAISAGGSTLYELAATGTPAIVLLQAENQLLGAKKMQKKGTIINLGFGNEVSNEKLEASVIDLIDDFDRRKRMSEVGQLLIDGFGAKRVAEKILESIG